MLDMAGAVVSIEAMACPRNIVEAIVDAQADHLLALKDNHKSLCEDVRLWLKTETAAGRLPIQETVDKGHGRIELRRCCLSAQIDIDWLEQKPEWKGLAAVGRVESTRLIGDKISMETRYYFCSFTELERFARRMRQHWVLDVQFGEGDNRARKDHSPENLAFIRRVALNLFNNNGPSKDNLRRLKLRVCLSDRYRTELIFEKRKHSAIALMNLY